MPPIFNIPPLPFNQFVFGPGGFMHPLIRLPPPPFPPFQEQQQTFEISNANINNNFTNLNQQNGENQIPLESIPNPENPSASRTNNAQQNVFFHFNIFNF